MRMILAWTLSIMMLMSLAGAETVPTLTEQGLELSGSSVRYPQLSGLADETLQAQINQTLTQALNADDYLNRMALLMSSPVKLTADWQGAVCGDILSVAMEAGGAVINNRSTHVWTTANVDLTTGAEIPLSALFADGAAALEAIGEYLEYTVGPELSAHLSAAALTPLPEQFTLSPTGLTLYYPVEQLATLSDKAGAVNLRWSEIAQHLDLSGGSVLDRLGAPAHLTLTEQSAQTLTATLSQGRLGDIPLTIGESVQALTDAHGLLIDPDLYEGGKMLLLEGAAYRGAYVLTDALTEDWTTSRVQGVRSDRLCYAGLQTGRTTREEYLAALGMPENTVTVDAAQAESWRIVPGTSDYYTMGQYRLRLHADESGVLASVFLTE